MACIGAVLMVVGAHAYRGHIDLPGLGAGGRVGDDGDSQTLVCAVELGDLCDRLGEDVVTEPAMETAERLIALPRGGDAELGTWLVPGAWPTMVDDIRRLTGLPPIF